MAAVGGMLASAVLKVVVGKIASPIGDQIMLQWYFNNDLEMMKESLRSVEAVLKDAERRSIKDAAVRLWLERLKNAMYGISDMIDEFEGTSTTPLRALVTKIIMANKMKKMRENLVNITNEHQRFSFTPDSSCNAQQLTDTRETASTVEEALILGRTDEKQKVMACLSGNITQDITILPIYGIGGIGKTTLAKLIFNDTQFSDYSRVWIYVSQTFDLNKIGNSIISQISDEQSKMTERQMIHNRLGKILAGKEILIVLDDLWEKNSSQLENLKTMLKVGEGSKVIVMVTTRDEDIARTICTIEPYKLAPLKDAICWDIIKQKSNFEARNDKDKLEHIGREIAVKCGGVALAAQSLGYMLKSKMFDEWESVQNSDIWNLSTLEDTSQTHNNSVLASLLLSYSRMPPYLKLCFAYCAIFPKGYHIVKDDLIHQWTALGFIEPSGIFSTRQLSENYVRQLLGMSFLHYPKSPSIDGLHNKDVTLFSMHDLVHDLARSVMISEVLDGSKKRNTDESSYRYALLTDCSKPLNLAVDSPAKIRTVRYLDCGKTVLGGAAFSSARFLHVLDLSECYIQKLPDSIGQLKQLRYLNASGIQDRMIPKSITKLSKLNYLNLRGSHNISALPESIGEMEGLMHLDLSGCLRLESLPVSFTKLSKLNYLNLRGSYNISALPEPIGEMQSLMHLDLSCCSGIEKLPVSFAKLKKLLHLDLSHCSGVKGISEVLGGLTKLQYLSLSYCHSLKELPEVISNLTELWYLNLSGCMGSVYDKSSIDQIDNSIDRISTLFNLEHLDLSMNIYLSSIPESIGSLKKLHTLDLSGCSHLMRLAESMAKMDSLKVVNVKGCNFVDRSIHSQFGLFALLPHFVVSGRDGEASSNLVLLQHANPVELKISSLENVKSAQEAVSIKLMDKQKIEELTLEWTEDAERFVEDMEVLEELVPPSTLKEFLLRGYNSVSFPAWLMDIGDYLPSFVRIEMWDLPECKSLPPLGQLPNLQSLVLKRMHNITRIEKGFYGGARAFPCLKEFDLIDLKSMEEWNTAYSSGEDSASELLFPNLEMLIILDCPKLRMKPRPARALSWEISNSDNVLSSWGENVSHTGASSYPGTANLEVVYYEVPLHQWRLLHHLSALTGLTIIHCNDLTSSPEIIQHLSSLKSLSLGDSDQAELPNWLGELTSLQKLEIIEYPELKELHQNIGKLTQLQSLSLSFCRSMKSLPPWLGKLKSLKKFQIWECGIEYLPQSIQRLTSLQELQISFCPKLKEWCSLRENKMMLAHIKQKSIRGACFDKSDSESDKEVDRTHSESSQLECEWSELPFVQFDDPDDLVDVSPLV